MASLCLPSALLAKASALLGPTKAASAAGSATAARTVCGFRSDFFSSAAAVRSKSVRPAVSSSRAPFLSVPPMCQLKDEISNFVFPGSPLRLAAPVMHGFGRGSRQMGVPTANMQPDVIEEELKELPRGVYFGWAQVPSEDPQVFKMVMNIGKRPTFVDGEGISVEVHILNSFEKDFYGSEVRVLVLGFIRPETKFSSVDDLVKQIFADIEVAKQALDNIPSFLESKDDFCFAHK